MSKPPKELLEVVISSLRTDPKAWKFRNCAASNEKLRAEIWMENRYYGTELKVGSCKYGGVTFISSFFGWISPWRRRLIKAAEFANLRQCLG